MCFALTLKEKIKYFCLIVVISLVRKKHIKLCINYFIIAVLSTVIYSCSAQKDKFLNRSYHRATTKFNGYFNGKESLKEAISKLEKTYQEDYNNLLPTTILGDQKQAQKIYPQLNRTIDKAGLIIERHSMEIKGEEKNKWIDDSYFLIGKALFYKQEYTEALEMFAFINREYEGYITDLSIMWSARAQIELENFTTAEEQMLYLDREVKLKKLDYALFLEINANYHIKQKNWKKVITYLSKAIEYSGDKKKRVRLTYLMGQIYHQLENYKSAYDAFDRVVRMNPEYEFLFNALLSRARAFDPKHNDSSKLISEINKMLKDDKNNDYKDQIYFALAEIALKEEQKDQAIDHLLSATANNTGNDQQQSIAHLTLAEIYFNDAEYLSAQVHYDTAITFLSENHPDFDALSKKRESLNELVNLYNTITLNDSLYKLSELDEDELKKIIDAIIEEKKEEERLAEEALRANAGARPNTNSRNQFNPMSGGGGKWYFYNTQSLGFGKGEFKRVWGNRPLEDNWRISDKSVLSTESNIENNLLTNLKNPRYEISTYLETVPTSAKDLDSLKFERNTALFELGLIYKEQFKNTPKAINNLERLLVSDPENELILPTNYHLYQLYSVSGNTKASQYKDFILNSYPDSPFSKIILNPEIELSKEKVVDEDAEVYEIAYRLYKDDFFEDAICFIDMTIPTLAEGSNLLSKFELLKAYAIGKYQNKDSYIAALEKVVVNFPQTEQGKKALEVMKRLKK